MRSADPDVCVLFLTARDAVEDRIAGITAGGDDYVTKPFSLEEVRRPAARAAAPGRHAGRATPARRLAVGDLAMDEDAPRGTPRRRPDRADRRPSSSCCGS